MAAAKTTAVVIASVSDTFPIIVTDNADESSVATDLVILITDTAPEAKADTGTVQKTVQHLKET